MLSSFKPELQKLRDALQALEDSSRSSKDMSRKVSRWYYWGSLIGGMTYIGCVLGLRWRMNIWKAVLIGYTINPIMLMTGTASIYVAKPYIID